MIGPPRARAAPRCLEGFNLKKKMKKRKDVNFGLVRGFKQKICMHARKCRENRGEIALLSKHKSGVVTTIILLYVLLYVLLRVFLLYVSLYVLLYVLLCVFCYMFCCVFFLLYILLYVLLYVLLY